MFLRLMCVCMLCTKNTSHQVTHVEQLVMDDKSVTVYFLVSSHTVLHVCIYLHFKAVGILSCSSIFFWPILYTNMQFGVWLNEKSQFLAQAKTRIMSFSYNLKRSILPHVLFYIYNLYIVQLHFSYAFYLCVLGVIVTKLFYWIICETLTQSTSSLVLESCTECKKTAMPNNIPIHFCGCVTFCVSTTFIALPLSNVIVYDICMVHYLRE